MAGSSMAVPTGWEGTRVIYDVPDVLVSVPDPILAEEDELVLTPDIEPTYNAPEGYVAPPDPPPVSSATTVYKKWLERSYGWFSQVIEEAPNCYHTFTFSEPTRITAISMASVSYVVKEFKPEDPDMVAAMPPTEFCSTIIAEMSTVIVSDDRYFIGNFTVDGSDDKETWTTLATSSNTTNLDKYVFLDNTSYYRYYRVNILNNASLDEEIFDNSFYGIGQLKFYAYKYDTVDGTENVALYEFEDKDSPKIVKISNASPQGGAEAVVTTTSGFYDIEGAASHAVISGTVGNFASLYYVSLHSMTDEFDAVTYGGFISPTISGVGTDDDVYTYLKRDKVGHLGPGTVELFDIESNWDSTMLVNVEQAFDTPIDTVDWTGTATTTYNTVASGTVTSGTPYYDLTGTTTRTYTETLYPRLVSYRLSVDELTTTSGVIPAGTELYMWGYSNAIRPVDLDSSNSVVFEVTTGEAYNCRLTAWDDVTHSTLLNELIQGDHARVSAVVYCGSYGKENPGESKSPLNLVYPPVHNRIFKGNTVVGMDKYYYGDFDMSYKFQDGVYGDFLLFKPMLYGIHSGISYGVHDFIVTLHYSYT